MDDPSQPRPSSPTLSADLSAVIPLLSTAPAVSTLWKPAPPRRAYAKSELLSLRHGNLYPLSPSDPIRRTPRPPPLLSSRESTTKHTSDVLLPPLDASLTFSDLQLPPPIVKVLASQQINHPSPVQLRALPLARLGSDVIIQAKSGTGKTLVFAIVATESATSTTSPSTQGPSALLLSPTRELAAQTFRVTQQFCNAYDPTPSVLLLIGGTPVREDVSKLASKLPSIVVATPGRALALVQSGCLKVSSLKLLVLDEADRLLDRSLGDAVPTICQLLPARMQTLAVSATYPDVLTRLLREVMRNPAHVQMCEDRPGGDHPSADAEDDGHRHNVNVSANRKAVLLGVQQKKMRVAPSPAASKNRFIEAKTIALTALMQQNPFSFCIVFTNDKKYGRSIVTHLRDKGFASGHIHADIRQSERTAIMRSVDQGKIQILISTDLIARGVDIDSCDLVVQLDVPMDSATYLHRVGRAGRFGKLGLSVVLYRAGREASDLQSLENELGFSMEELEMPRLMKGHDAPPSRTGTLSRPEEGNSGDKHRGEKATGSCAEEEEVENHPSRADIPEPDSVHVRKRRKAGHNPVSRSPKKYEVGRAIREAKESANAAVVGQATERNVELYDSQTNDQIQLQTGIEMIDVTEDQSSFPGVNEQSRLDEATNEAWAAYARQAYSEGYQEAYERAYRMAKQLGKRLLG